MSTGDISGAAALFDFGLSGLVGLVILQAEQRDIVGEPILVIREPLLRALEVVVRLAKCLLFRKGDVSCKLISSKGTLVA